MAWPTGSVPTTNFDSGADSPAQARADLLNLIQKLNTMISHGEPAKTDGSNASGTWDITAERLASAFAGFGISISPSGISIASGASIGGFAFAYFDNGQAGPFYHSYGQTTLGQNLVISNASSGYGPVEARLATGTTWSCRGQSVSGVATLWQRVA